MSAATASLPAGAPAGRGSMFAGRNLAVLLAAGGILIISLARILADADNLTASTTVGVGVRLAVPIAMAGIGGLFAERSGTVNIGLEGMMVLGTVMAGYFGWHWGPWAALIAAAVGGMLGGLLMSLATTTFGVNHIIAGFAINIIGPGVARFLANVWFTEGEATTLGGSISNSPEISGEIRRVSLPVLSDQADLLGDLEDKGWFVLSDLAGVLRGLTADIRLDTIICLLLITAGGYLVWRTPFGLRLRSAGEKPGAAESLGVSVIRMRYYGMALSGAFAGMAGAIVAFTGANRYQEGQTAGRGFLGMGALVFGNWRPAGVVTGAGVFGYAQGIELNLNASALVRGLILAAGMALAVATAVAVYQRMVRRAVAFAAIAALAFFTYATVEEVNNQFTYMTPYIVPLVVVAIFSKRLRPPAAAGIPYFKGQQL